MQIVETLNEGLRRAFTITIPAADVDAKVDEQLKRMAPQMRLPGFRPGKVPPNLVRKMHGAALHGEALNESVKGAVQTLLEQNRLRPAMQPEVALNEDYEPGQDARVDVSLEALPELPAPKIEGIKLERLTVAPSEEQIDAELQKLVGSQRGYDPAPEGHGAEMGDLVVIDYVGKVDGEPFEGGAGEGMQVALGSGQLIPGFEHGLLGAKAGEARTLDLAFPADYNVDSLKGQAATFNVTIAEVKRPGETKADDAFAQSLGLEGIQQLRGLVKGQLEQDGNGLTRTHMKRRLLDELAARHDFPVPETMVEAEFGQIWRQLEQEAGSEADPEAARAEMERERDDYRRIAERRVRLGLLLSEIGSANKVGVTQAEMERLIGQAAQQYRPEDRERFIQYVNAEPMAAAQLRAPLFEDKVVDWLFSQAEISERSVSRDELEREIESEDGGHVHGPDCGHDEVEPAAAPKAKPKRATKTKSDRSDGEVVESHKLMKESSAHTGAKEKPRRARKKIDDVAGE